MEESDCQLLWEWVNDPDTRASAFESKRVPWSTHVAWFRKKRTDPQCRPFIITNGREQSIGQVRFDIQNDGDAIIDISITPDKRRHGIGSAALRLACVEFLRTTSCRRITAHIKIDNIASIRAFRKAGFENQGHEWIKGQSTVKMTLTRNA